MLSIRKSLAAAAGLTLIVGLTAPFAPASTRGRGGPPDSAAPGVPGPPSPSIDSTVNDETAQIAVPAGTRLVIEHVWPRVRRRRRLTSPLRRHDQGRREHRHPLPRLGGAVRRGPRLASRNTGEPAGQALRRPALGRGVPGGAPRWWATIARVSDRACDHLRPPSGRAGAGPTRRAAPMGQFLAGLPQTVFQFELGSTKAR
jgi:hypothetical protein